MCPGSTRLHRLFCHSHAEEVFELLACGDHLGKIVIKMSVSSTSDCGRYRDRMTGCRFFYGFMSPILKPSTMLYVSPLKKYIVNDVLRLSCPKYSIFA